MVDRKGKARIRLVSTRSKEGTGDDKGATPGPNQDVIAIGLGYRILISESAEVWTLAGVLRDGGATKDEVGELSFVVIPGDTEPACAITGFLAPTPPYVLAMPEPQIEEQLRNLVMQLGYDREGYYLSVGVGGSFIYHEDFRQE